MKEIGCKGIPTATYCMVAVEFKGAIDDKCKWAVVLPPITPC